MDTLQGTFEGVATTVNSAKEEKKEFLKGLKNDLQEKIANDPDYVARLQSLSDSIQVNHTLGAGTDGNIVVDKSSPERKLKNTSAIVGYEVQNVGSEPISYQTEVWTRGEDGKYVAQPTEKTMAPGETANLTRKFMTILCSRPEISFTLKNGKIVSRTAKKKSTDELLESFYFTFNDDTPVNDDAVKKAVDEEGADGTRVVKAEYVEAFGYLNNPKEKAGKKAAKAKVSVQDLMANYVNTLINQ